MPSLVLLYYTNVLGQYLLLSMVFTANRSSRKFTKVGTSLKKLHTIGFGSRTSAHVRRPLYTPLATSCFMLSRLYCICHVSPAHIQKPTADPISRTPGNANPRRGLNRAIHDRPPGLKKGMSSRRLYDAPDMHAKSRICRVFVCLHQSCPDQLASSQRRSIIR